LSGLFFPGPSLAVLGAIALVPDFGSPDHFYSILVSAFEGVLSDAPLVFVKLMCARFPPQRIGLMSQVFFFPQIVSSLPLAVIFLCSDGLFWPSTARFFSFSESFCRSFLPFCDAFPLSLPTLSSCSALNHCSEPFFAWIRPIRTLAKYSSVLTHLLPQHPPFFLNPGSKNFPFISSYVLSPAPPPTPF